jgi:hypothetical protein
MCSHDVIMPKANRPGSRLQPKRYGAALIRRTSVSFPDDTTAVVARVRRFGFVGTRFKKGVHIFALGLKSSRNHMALLSVKLNPMRLDGEPHNPSGLRFAPDIVNTRDEFTKRQGPLPAILLHALKCKPGNHADAMGCSPHL